MCQPVDNYGSGRKKADRFDLKYDFEFVLFG